MDSAAAAFALDKPALGPGPPPPPPAMGPGDCAQARKNFSVSHLLDLEEVAAAGRLAARPGARAEAREGAAREPSGGSSGSEAAPQDGCRDSHPKFAQRGTHDPGPHVVEAAMGAEERRFLRQVHKSLWHCALRRPGSEGFPEWEPHYSSSARVSVPARGAVAPPSGRRSSGGTAPRSTAASCRRWSACSSARTTPTPLCARSLPGASTSARRASRSGFRTAAPSSAGTKGPCWPAAPPRCSSPTARRPPSSSPWLPGPPP
ncbi:paired mesoderm homeobox protein 2 isoform X5 [Pongo abelii]|uniref:paired mesoderm homeobox protein 2 isoform X5 n=1 Tax=Pongo abelii TaxID=9601 RepID=UPI000CEF89BF|nr:paired mesoderm homeobox protein 2 isoform X4 [Pongo abelii]XP_054377172.1 paired mesoderm homeobox protein 2 isoform X4 [Pongo abelii]